MTLPGVGVVTLLLLLAGGSHCLAQAPKPEPAPAAKKDLLPPIVFFVAKGEQDACGKGCDTWIAAEGEIDNAASSRFRKFLRQLKSRDLPIYFSSPGGNVEQGIAMGYALREKPMTARVARTVVRECGAEAQNSPSCLKLKQSGQVLQADLVMWGAMCNSSCANLILGAAKREIPFELGLGIHTPKIFLNIRNGAHPTAAQIETALRRGSERSKQNTLSYMRKMGVDTGMHDLMMTVKFENMHLLTREEMYRFRIDTREHVETTWALESQARPFLGKSAWVKAADGASFRRMGMRLYCASDDRVRLVFLRDADKGSAAIVSLASSSDKPIALTKTPWSNTILAWSAAVPSDEMKALLAAPQLQIAEVTGADDKRAERKFEIETFGLEDAWTRLSAVCKSPSAAATPI